MAKKKNNEKKGSEKAVTLSLSEFHNESSWVDSSHEIPTYTGSNMPTSTASYGALQGGKNQISGPGNNPNVPFNPPFRAIVGNLSKTNGKESLVAHMEKVGGIKLIKVRPLPNENSGGKSRGGSISAIAEFHDRESLLKLLNFDSFMLDSGLRMSVKLEESAGAGGKFGRDGGQSGRHSGGSYGDFGNRSGSFNSRDGGYGQSRDRDNGRYNNFRDRDSGSMQNSRRGPQDSGFPTRPRENDDSFSQPRQSFVTPSSTVSNTNLSLNEVLGSDLSQEKKATRSCPFGNALPVPVNQASKPLANVLPNSTELVNTSNDELSSKANDHSNSVGQKICPFGTATPVMVHSTKSSNVQLTSIETNMQIQLNEVQNIVEKLPHKKNNPFGIAKPIQPIQDPSERKKIAESLIIPDVVQEKVTKINNTPTLFQQKSNIISNGENHQEEIHHSALSKHHPSPFGKAQPVNNSVLKRSINVPHVPIPTAYNGDNVMRVSQMSNGNEFDNRPKTILKKNTVNDALLKASITPAIISKLENINQSSNFVMNGADIHPVSSPKPCDAAPKKRIDPYGGACATDTASRIQLHKEKERAEEESKKIADTLPELPTKQQTTIKIQPRPLEANSGHKKHDQTVQHDSSVESAHRGKGNRNFNSRGGKSRNPTSTVPDSNSGIQKVHCTADYKNNPVEGLLSTAPVAEPSNFAEVAPNEKIGEDKIDSDGFAIVFNRKGGRRPPQKKTHVPRGPVAQKNFT